ncbi:MAG: hypothetical protein JW920_06480 [Deltaproteobacteria bacterium]|nr:hypothetical protein [Deltaproteobacteria bacterium]
MREEDGNEIVQQTLARLVVEKITGLPFDKASATVGPLAINYFSVVFSVTANTSMGSQSVFVKIPKEDLRQRSKSIFPISPADRRMAEDEELSLRTLDDQWHSDDLDVSWIRLRGVFPHYNAIVTDAVEGGDAFAVFRQMDLRRRLGSKKDCLRLRGAMNRLGAALGRFHQGNARNTVFHVNESIPKLEWYCQEIEASVRSSRPSYVIQALNSISSLEIETVEVPTLKGIDIRNVLIDKKDKLFLLDPGRMKRTCREADLARFIMTYRILYWGSGLFLLGLRPDSQSEESFLDAYYSNSVPSSPKLLSFFLIKEQLKHWHTAVESLRLLPWPMPLKRLIAATYVNPYYTRQLAMELKKVI